MNPIRSRDRVLSRGKISNLNKKVFHVGYFLRSLIAICPV